MPPTTPLRKLYRVLGPVFPAAGQLGICDFLLTESPLQSTRHLKRLADLFDGALHSAVNTGFDAASHPFNLEGRLHPDKGSNDTCEAMAKLEGRMVRAEGVSSYAFEYRYREVQILRPESRASQHPAGSAWVDCMGMSSKGRPVLCEIKCGTDQNAFYALIQLLTYLSEVATEHQRARTREHLFRDWSPDSHRHDLVILLVDPTLGGLKGELLRRTEKLASGLAKRLQEDHERSSLMLGNIVCLRGSVDHEKKEFRHPLETLWFVEG
jgi:hypothetical protein